MGSLKTDTIIKKPQSNAQNRESPGATEHNKNVSGDEVEAPKRSVTSRSDPWRQSSGGESRPGDGVKVEGCPIETPSVA
ncbi:MAG: hypothetical protein A2289_23375 [Deltaproteobacteria bacterium RIFOXYA12_FULL_58_15]|nr:MAG: hypothetical protein A2289_23375 [Deltaproteobacteria bacterium RIFOXYA12_FULL_58_15]OGR13286.1 MAG: hypothetical protein A2341_16120 [Deltaproteobacteria bacterium RIFOXYB12_FULL_58_9]